jgi:hypothetical protein
MRIDAHCVLHVVRHEQGHETLYLNDGKVVVWSPSSGKVDTVVELPDAEELNKRLRGGVAARSS